MWYWYIKRDDELLIDIDQPYRLTRSGKTWLQEFFFERLEMACQSGLLSINRYIKVNSTSQDHVHIYVELCDRIGMLLGLIWQLQLGSDLYRGRADLMRLARGNYYPSLLIEPRLVTGWRNPDFRCECDKKHVTGEAPNCEVWLKIRGNTPWELFGRPLSAAQRRDKKEKHE